MKEIIANSQQLSLTTATTATAISLLISGWLAVVAAVVVAVAAAVVVAAVAALIEQTQKLVCRSE